MRRVSLFLVCVLIAADLFAADEKVKTATKPKRQATPAAVVETESSRTQPLGAKGPWKKVPDYLEGVEIQTQPLQRVPKGREFNCTIKTGGVVVVAAARTIQNNSPSPKEDQEFRAARKALEAQGWVIIGSIRQKDQPGGGEMTLFRRVMKTGEKLEFATGLYSLPALVLLNDKQAEKALAQKAMIVSLQDLTYLRPPKQPAGLNAKSPRDIVMLTTHELEPSLQGPGILQRELGRQAFLLAAREELGLATRDMSLREAFPRESDPVFLPFDILVTITPKLPARLAIFRQKGQEYEILWEKELNLAAEGTFEDLVTQCEELSRKDFIEVLRRVGLKKKERVKGPTDQPSTEAHTGLGEFNFIAQFSALRRLHAALQAHGDSPELLGGLAREYANLGAETAFLWSPAHKVFEARALLYAERLVRQTKGSPWGLWNRAYVRGVGGRHKAALDDLARAAKATPETSDATTGKMPDWVDLIRAHCDFDQARLAAAEENDQTRPLARYLQMLEQEFAPGTRTRLGTAGNVLEVAPDSFRAMDLSATASLEIARAARQQALELFPTSLYRRLENVPDVPPEAAEIAMAERENQEDRELQVEMKTRGKLITVLNRAAGSAKDRAEPSLGVLAALIQEVGFVHAWRMVDFLDSSLSVPADETIDALGPLFEAHPYRKYIESLRSDKAAAATVLKELASSIDTSELEMTEIDMLIALLHSGGNISGTGRGFFETTFNSLAFFRFDPLYRDLAYRVLAKENNYKEHHRAELKAVSPDSPLSVAAEIEFAGLKFAPKEALNHLAEWEQKFAKDPTVLSALADHYTKFERYDDALRIAKLEFAASPGMEQSLRLARLYKKQGDVENWKATLDTFLKQESFGLEHSVVQIEIANHYMNLKKWDEALPYSLQAAATYSGAGLLSAASCYDGMQDWENAELYVRRCSERYSSASGEWFFWCKRRGRGDSEAARRLAHRFLDSAGDSPYTEIVVQYAAFQLLCGEPEAAMKACSVVLDKTSDPWFGLMAALAAHDLGKTGQRDKLLEQTRSRGLLYEVNDRPRKELVGLADMFKAEIAAGKKARFDEEKFAAFVKSAPPGEPTNLHYFAGRFLAHQGQAEQARKHLLQAATSPYPKIVRTLAAAVLREQKVEIGEIRDKE